MFDDKKKSYVYIVVLALVAATLPLRNIPPNSISIIVLGAVWLIDIARTRRIKNNLRNPYLVLPVAFFLLVVVSLLYSNNVRAGGRALELRLPILVLPLAILSIRHFTRKMYHLALAFFAAACIVTSLVCLVSTFYTNHINGMAYSAATSWMYSSENLTKDFGFHPSYLATFCSTSIFILIYFCRQKLLGLLPTVVGGLYLFAFIFLLASRIGLLALLAVLSLTILYETYRRNRMLLGLFLTTTLLLAVATGIYFSDTAREKFYAMVGYNIHEYNAAFQVHRRYAIWGSALTLIQENPLLGVGIGDMREDLAVAHGKTGFEEGHEQRYNAHNLFLETAAATGIVSLIVLLALLFLSARHALRHNNMLHLQFLLLFLCISMVESTLSVQKGIVFFSFMNALFIAAGTLSIPERAHGPDRSQATPA